MPHQNTVFRQLAKHLPMAELDRLVAQHNADKGIRRLSTKGMLLALLFAQLSGAKGLRDIEAVLRSQDARRYHSGLPAVHRSTLADAAASRPVEVFAGVLAHLIAGLTAKLARGIGQCARLIDSTTIKLSTLSGKWSRFSADMCGAKAHIVYDPDAGCPVYLAVTPARVNDITAAKEMPIEPGATPGATYVFDLGYYDFGWWAKLDAAGCRIVTRLKANTKLQMAQTRAVPAADGNADGGVVLSDRTGLLQARMARNRRNPMSAPVREIEVLIDTGKVLRLLTNDLDAPAAEIAALYKRRWAIELFFRWIKQTLKLRHFYGQSENAVRLQIAVALIAFVLIKLAHQGHQGGPTLTQFARLIGATVLHRKPIGRLGLTGPPSHPPNQNNAQGVLQWG